MAALSRDSIVGLIKTGDLYIAPLLSKDQIGPISIDLRMGNLVMLVRARGLSHVDPKQYHKTEAEDTHSHQQAIRQKFERYDLPFRVPFLLHPGTLALVPTLEWIKIPGNMKGVVTARSSWAREGLNIASANFINPNYNGIITLELANFGQIPMAIYPGMRIAQIAFYEVDKSIADDGKESQFTMSFEPTAGKITSGDEVFLPSSS